MGEDLTPFQYQEDVATQVSMPSVLNIPTGAGKTAAAILGWLYRRRFHPNGDVRGSTPRRLVYCLPMRSLVEQTYDSALRMVENLGVADVVSVNLLMGGEVGREWYSCPADDQIIIGTQDMLVSRILNRGYGISKTTWGVPFGLLNNDCFWVLDEIQLMGPALPTLLQMQGIRDQLGTIFPTKTLLMSATVDEESLTTVDNPHVSDEVYELTPEDFRNPLLQKRIKAHKSLTISKLSVGDRKYGESIAHHILSSHQPGTLTIYIGNQVKRVQEIHRRLRRIPDCPKTLLLHSRFREGDKVALRTAIDEIGDEGLILVATQVVEAGMDISSKNMITELAPWPSLVQRFGRCNRYGEHDQANITIVTGGVASSPAPYDEESLVEAEEILKGLSGLSISEITTVQHEPRSKTHPVIRKKDVLELMETSPDISGRDIDISRFIRSDKDRDVLAWWDDLDESTPTEANSRVYPPSVCRVSLAEMGKFLRGGKGDIRAWTYDFVSRRWARVRASSLRPGLKILIDRQEGGYSDENGWTGKKSDRPSIIKAERATPPTAAGHVDAPSYSVIDMNTHSYGVAERIRSICQSLRFDGWMADALVSSGIHHDIGKAHPAFQHALGNNLDGIHSGEIWAKGPGAESLPNSEDDAKSGRKRNNFGLIYHTLDSEGKLVERPLFRHELVSALYLLAHGENSIENNLVAWLVGSHHGQVGLRIRSIDGESEPSDNRLFARGVWDGDEVPAIPSMGIPAHFVDMSYMEMGAENWSQRCYDLRDDPRLGPFRMAYLSTLLRISDWAVSSEEMGGGDAT